jgi:hypothetical protein
VYSNSAVDAAVDSFTNVILPAMDLAIPQGFIKSRFPHWFSHTLIYYILKKNYFYRRYKKSKNEYYYSKFSHYWKLVKITIKFDRINRYKSIDDDLKTQPSKFWRYVSSFRKRTLHTIYLDIYVTNVVEPTEVAEAFAKHFQSVYNTTTPAGPYSGLLSSDFLHLPPITELDILKAIKCLRPSKSVGPDSILSSIIKGCSIIFILLLKYIFNLSLSQEHFPAQLKKAVTVPILEKVTVLSLVITDQFLF